MSRSANIVETPVVKTFKWKNRKEEIQKDEKGKVIKDEKGKPVTEVIRETGWYYWNKNLGEKGEEVLINMPFSFYWLESASSISGYNKEAGKGVYSNEVLNLKTQPMVVKMGNEVIIEGIYDKIKKEVKGQGGKFCVAVYALMKNEEDEYEVVRFLMVGSSRTAWFDFANRTKNKTHAIACYDVEEKFTETGSMYEQPVFKYMEANPKDIEAADKAAIELVDPYFKYVLNKPKEELVTSDVEDDDEDSSDYGD